MSFSSAEMRGEIASSPHGSANARRDSLQYARTMNAKRIRHMHDNAHVGISSYSTIYICKS